MNKELALKLIEEGDDEAEMSLRKKKGKVGEHGSENEAAVNKKELRTAFTNLLMSINLTVTLACQNVCSHELPL